MNKYFGKHSNHGRRALNNELRIVIKNQAFQKKNESKQHTDAASSTTDALTLFPDANALADTIAAIEVASPAGDASRCPSMGTKFPYFSGEHTEEDDSPYDHR